MREQMRKKYGSTHAIKEIPDPPKTLIETRLTADMANDPSGEAAVREHASGAMP
jgi:hypothetical protein